MRRTIRTIARRAVAPEVKYVGANLIDSMFNSQISTAAECYPVMPPVTQGDGDHQRVGDKIKGRYLYVKGYVTYDQTTVAGGQSGAPNHPIVARLLILSQKNIRSNNLIPNVKVGNLLDDRIGTDATRPFDGLNSYDCTAPINKDLFVVHYDRKIRLYPQGLAGAGSGSEVWTQGQKAVFFKAKIKTPNTLTYDDSAMPTPGTATNFAPFMCVGWAYADGEAPPEPTVTPVHVQCQSTVYFTDV